MLGWILECIKTTVECCNKEAFKSFLVFTYPNSTYYLHFLLFSVKHVLQIILVQDKVV